MKFVKEKSSNISRWGENPDCRDITKLIPRSLIIIDKPEGPSSHQVSSWVKKIFKEKAAHSGTLDPNVTGVLPMGIGRSVRVLDLLHSTSKEYIAAMRLHGNIGKKEVEKAINDFEGEIYQVPPLKSGVKRERRKKWIYKIEILDHRKKEYLLRVRCESGTYIRTLCKDIGKSIGVGAHMMELRRIEAGGFTEKDTILLQDLKDAYEYFKEGEEEYLREILLPYERALDIFPKVKVKDTAAGAIINGADLAVQGILEMDDFNEKDEVAIISEKGEGLAVGLAQYDAEKIMKMGEGLIVKTDRVFSPTGDYPKTWG